jgi:hypothetical protein
VGNESNQIRKARAKKGGVIVALCSNNIVAQAGDGIDVRVIQPQTGIHNSTRRTGRASNDGLNL